MTKPRSPYLKTFTIILLHTLACGDINNSTPPNAPPPDSSFFDVGASDTEDTFNDTDIFQKPEGDQHYGDGLGEVFTCANSTCNNIYNHNISSPRPHVAVAPGHREIWLYEGEYLVIDNASILGNQFFWIPGGFQVVALHEGRALPIRYIEVDGPEFPSMEEIESWPESDYSTVQTIYREPYKYFNSTFVIPPWAFPEKGAYNVQLLILPVWQPAEHHRYFFEGGSAYHKTYTLYYGSENSPPHTEIDDRQDQAVVWENTAAGGYVGDLNYNFLAPPTDIFDWTQWSWLNRIPAGHLTRAFDSPRREVTFDFFTINGELAETFTTGQNLYYVMRDEEVIDMFLLEPPSMPPRVDGWIIYDWERDRGFRLPITVVLTEAFASYKVVVVPDPFEPLSDFPTPLGQVPLVSNALLMRYAPEE